MCVPGIALTHTGNPMRSDFLSPPLYSTASQLDNNACNVSVTLDMFQVIFKGFQRYHNIPDDGIALTIVQMRGQGTERFISLERKS